MLTCNTIQYKGHRLSYYKTNFGSLFLARTLLAFRKGITYCTSPLQHYVNMALTVKLPIGGVHAPICVGLKGFKQIFADKPDEELEELLISLNIVQGELPVTEDIKVLTTEGNRESSVTKVDDDFTQKILNELETVKRELTDIKEHNATLQQDLQQALKQIRRFKILFSYF